MLDWVRESLRQLIIRKYGKDVWSKVVARLDNAGTTECYTDNCYFDAETFALITTIGSVIGVSRGELLESYGSFLIQFAMESGWAELLQVLAPDLQGFLEGIDSLHYFVDHVVFRTQLNGPSFRCESVIVEDKSIVFHYYSRWPNLHQIVKGAIHEIARKIYAMEVAVKIHSQHNKANDNFVKEHVVFYISQGFAEYLYATKGAPSVFCRANLLKLEPDSKSQKTEKHAVLLADFCDAFPHHLCFDSELRIQHVGTQIHFNFPNLILGETRISELLELINPQIPFNFESMHAFYNSVFIFRLKEMSSSKRKNEIMPDTSTTIITLKGSMHSLSGGVYLCYMCSLNVTTLRELIERGLYISDIQRHDSTRDLIMLNQTRTSQVQLNAKLEETTRRLLQLASELEKQKQRTEELLCELMPRSVADSLRRGLTVAAAEFAEATVLFSDIVSFTNICAHCTPYDVVNMLNDLYLRFDRLVGLHGVYKVETIGDGYMLAGGVPEESRAHCERVLNTALGMLAESRRVVSPITRQPVNIRVGVHAGPIVAGVVGVKMPRYCLFGHTIYVANHMESSGIPGRVHVSTAAMVLANKTNPGFKFKQRGRVEIKV